MKKRLLGILPLIGITLGLSGCSSVGDGAASQSIIYGVAAILCGLIVRQKHYEVLEEILKNN